MPRLTKCRSCRGSDLHSVLDLGQQPIANALREATPLAEPEKRFPLEIVFCASCALVQVTETIPAETLFGRDYPYFSSVSAALLDHSRRHAEQLMAERELGPSSFIVEVASNDGYLLRNFVDFGLRVLGIDPAAGPAAAAESAGVQTRVAFFCDEVAQSIVAEYGRADVIIANNVLAHVGEINDFVAGFATLLKPDGIARFEIPYLRRLIESLAFDTIYHEHLFYYSLLSLRRLFNRHGLHLIDAEEISIHGGSLRLTVSLRNGQSDRLLAMIDDEIALGMDRPGYYAGFAHAVSNIRHNLRDLVRDLNDRGARVRAYGAAAKGATLLNYVELGRDELNYVVDLNAFKVGKIMPGVALPIRSVEALAEEQPEYLLLLAWNFSEEIMSQQAEFARRGGRFIIPVPQPRVVSPTSASRAGVPSAEAGK